MEKPTGLLNTPGWFVVVTSGKKPHLKRVFRVGESHYDWWEYVHHVCQDVSYFFCKSRFVGVSLALVYNTKFPILFVLVIIRVQSTFAVFLASCFFCWDVEFIIWIFHVLASKESWLSSQTKKCWPQSRCFGSKVGPPSHDRYYKWSEKKHYKWPC